MKSLVRCALAASVLALFLVGCGPKHAPEGAGLKGMDDPNKMTEDAAKISDVP